MLVIFGILQNSIYNMNVKIGICLSDGENTNIRNKLSDDCIYLYDETSLYKSIEKGDLMAGIIVEGNIANKVLVSTSNTDNLNYIEPLIKSMIRQINNIDVEEPAYELKYIKDIPIGGFEYIFPGILIFAIMQIALSGGLTILGLKQKESLRRLKVTPLSKFEFITSFSIGYFVIIMAQTILNIIIGLVFFDYNFVGNLSVIILLLLVSSFAFIALGIVLTNFANSIEMGNTITRFASFPAAFFCNVFIPETVMPAIVQKIAFIHPLTYFVNVFRAFCDKEIAEYSQGLIIQMIMIVLMFVCFIFLGVRYFRWEDQVS
jgi:ABC-2 type transport system permease protein